MHIPDIIVYLGKYNTIEFVLSEEPAQEEVVEPLDEEGMGLIF